MAVAMESEVIEFDAAAGRNWWLFLVTGIAWSVIAFMILTVDPATPAMIGFLAGFVLILSGVNELVTVALVDDWRWLHVLLGILFIAGGFVAFFEPVQTFGVLALFIGWYLLIKGLADIVLSVIGRDFMPLWGLMLASGIFEIVIGVWAIGYPGRSAWLLILWVGLAALIRGITEIVLAFKLHSAGPSIP